MPMTKMLRENKVTLKSQAIDEKIIFPRVLTVVVESMRERCEVRATSSNPWKNNLCQNRYQWQCSQTFPCLWHEDPNAIAEI